MTRKLIITAGASGIGLAIARHFASKRALVATCDIDAAAISRVTDEFALAATCDVTDVDTVASLVDQAVECMDGLTTVIANAGTAGPTALIEDIAPEDWAQTIAVNLTRQYALCRAAIPFLKAHYIGSVILMFSAVGRIGLPMRSPYAAAKWGVVGLKETLAMELGPHSFTVNAILPGSVKGPHMDAVLAAKAAASDISLDAARTAEVQNKSHGRMIEPAEIAELAWVVASPDARSMSEQSLRLCGTGEF